MQHQHLEYHNRADVDHWWFAARRRIVLDQIRRRIARSPGHREILDLGCGAGGMLNYLSELGTAYGVDGTPEAVEFARAKTDAQVEVGGLPDQVPFDPGRFDIVTLLDVLEHVEDDRGSLKTIGQLLRPGGFVLITVPACPFLWSEHDDLNEHHRRYTRSELREKLETAGFRIRKLTYFNTLLFPPIALARLLQRLRPPRGHADEGNLPSTLNMIFRMVFSLEKPLLRWLSLPVGVSLLALADGPNQQGVEHDG